MIKFIKKYSNLLPYSKKRYKDYLDDDINDDDLEEKWYGYSIQMPQDDCTLSNAVNIFTPILRDIILSFGLNTAWIISHEYKDMEWFNKYIKEDKLPILWNLFLKNDVVYPFKGGIKMDSNVLLSCIKNLIEYAPILSYKNIDISNMKVPLIIKLTDHITLDLLSNDEDLLNKHMTMLNTAGLKIIKYR